MSDPLRMMPASELSRRFFGSLLRLCAGCDGRGVDDVGAACAECTDFRTALGLNAPGNDTTERPAALVPLASPAGARDPSGASGQFDRHS